MYGNQETILTTDDTSKPGGNLTNDPTRPPKPAPRALSPIPPPVAPRTDMGVCVCVHVSVHMYVHRNVIVFDAIANSLLFHRKETTSYKT